MLRSIFFAGCTLLTVARAELSFDKPMQEFRRLPEDGHVEAHFAFKNTGTEPVTVKRVQTSCGCTSARLDRNTFAPGEGSEIVVKFTFGSRRGPQRKIITVATEDKKEVALDLRVWIQEPLMIAPALVFWKVGDTAEEKSVELTVAPSQNMTVTGVKSSNPRVSATLVTLKPGEKYSVKVKPADTAQKEAAELTVQTNFPPDAPRSYTVFARVK
jgi:Protein of unknown function (DUF1573)